MRMYFAFIAIALLCSFTPAWETDFAVAKVRAQQEKKYILLNFSGSDWCGPCIRMHSEIFGSDQFKQFADANLVLVNADFPRQKKNRLPKEQEQQNDRLADTYNAAGSFPFTVLLDASGKVLKSWDGFPKEKTDVFIDEINQVIHGKQ
ncbi:thioredoxin family protein [Chitinophaga oryziterrae]|nr:thioredoxin family protein [Chitinophaga oryziterrae]